MLPLFEMLMKANGGDAMNQMAKQFGLNQTQVHSAMEALLPAFSIGLKRNAANPMDMGNLLQTLAGGGYANAFNNAASAFNPAGTQAGNDILGQLFGSKDVSRAVAAQAAQATGIGQDILKQMLPAVASMMAGGMQQQMAGGLGAAGMGAGGNVFGKVIEEMMKQAGGQGAQAQAPAPSGNATGNPWGDMLGQILKGATGGLDAQPQTPAQSGNPWGDILGQVLGGASGQQAQPQRQAPPAEDNPLGNILKDMLGGGQTQSGAGSNPFGKMLEEMMKGGGQATPEPEEEPQAAPQGRAKTTASNPWGDMFETGKKTQDSYQKGLESIFDQYLKGMDRNR